MGGVGLIGLRHPLQQFQELYIEEIKPDFQGNWVLILLICFFVSIFNAVIREMGINYLCVA